MLYNYDQFLNESLNRDNEVLNSILDTMLKIPTEDIMEFKKDIEILSDMSENMNEGLSDTIRNIQRKFRRWFTDKLFHYLINRKKDFYGKLLDKLNIFDLKNVEDVAKAFPEFKFGSMYLAGGMDAAKEGGKVGWRNEVENYLEEKSDYDTGLPKVELYMNGGQKIKEISPSLIVDGELLTYFVEHPKKALKFYGKPAILNPVRKEVDRNKMDFDIFFSALKNANAPQKDIEEAINFFKRTFNDSIVWGDEVIINNTDCIFLGVDKTAGAGTFAELELISFLEKPLFTWLVDNILYDFKLWNYPQLTKLARTKREMQQMLDSLYDYYIL